MNLLVALHYNARREDPAHIRCQLAAVAEAHGRATTARERRRLERRRRALEQRLRYADALAHYDWEAAEADFAEFARSEIQTPGVYERWRHHGVPVRVLLKAGYKPHR